MKRLLCLLILVSFLIPVSVSADAIKIGDKIVLKGGFEATVVGFTDVGNPIYEANFSTPKYLPDLKTKIDTTWKANGDGYTAGSNLFFSSVNSGMVSVQDSKGNSFSWSPSLTIENLEQSKDKSGASGGTQNPVAVKGTILVVDPINTNYRNNTLEWDYGHGLYRRLRIIEGMVQEYYVITKAVGGDVVIKANASKSSNYKSDRMAVAYDNNGDIIDLIQDDNHNTKLTKEKGTDPKVKYPVIIDPDSTFISSASDGTLKQYSTVSFNAVRTAATATGFGVEASTFRLIVNSQYEPGPYYYMARAFVYFDTSSLLGYTVTAASLGLFLSSKADSDTYSVQIQSGQPTYPHDPLVTGDYLYTNYSGNGGAKALSTFAGGYNTVTMTDLTMINQSGTTKLALRLTGDINNTAPTGYNELQVYSYEMGSGYQPYLVVTFTGLTPGITSQAASNVAQTTAQLNAAVTHDGGEGCTVRWGYGTTSQTAGNFAIYDTVTSWSTDTYNTGDTPYLAITTLVPNTIYFYRVQLDNSIATVTSTTEQTFTTTTGVASPTAGNFYGIPLSAEIDLSWVVGTGSSQSLLRYRTDTYPTSTTDGNYLQLSNATTYEHTGLLPGKTYYYSLWGESGGTYSTEYLTLAVTTKGTDPFESGNPSNPTTPIEFFQPVDASGLSAFEPIPTIVGMVATSWAMPVNNVWFLWTMLGIIVATAGIYLKWNSLAGAICVSVALMFVAILLKLIPGYMIVMPVMVTLGAWALWRFKPS